MREALAANRSHRLADLKPHTPRLVNLSPRGFLTPSQGPLSFAPGMLIEGAEHGERHGLNTGFDGRFRHRSEQRRMIGRKLRPGSVACRGHALGLVDA